uniref:Ig-like domain-containing protein n=1 Tax=Paramormyrops kingsleyae TaxID=1676925 RepID=A0A3B3RY89_9TELE
MIRLCVILAHFSKLCKCNRECLLQLLIFFFFSDLALSNTVVQPSPLLTVEAGDNVTLECSFPKDEAHSVFWFKLIINQRPLLIASTFKFASEATFHNNFNPTRYKVKIYEEINHLIILKTEPSESGMYYCGTRRDYLILFGAGTFLTIKVEQYPVSDPVQPGDSVTLQCTIETGGCAGEHSVYWFRHGSGESLPGVIYSHGNRSDECERSPEAGSPTRSCVYSLPKRNLSSSDAGTYYCAVAMCGEMLFGNGTKIHIEESKFLIKTLFMQNKIIAPLFICYINYTTICRSNPDAEMLNYAALHFTQKKGESRRKTRETEDCSLYSDVRLRD